MDTSTGISIWLSVASIVVAAILTIVGIAFSIKSTSTLSSIQNEVKAQTKHFMHLLEKYQTSNDELTNKLMDMHLKTLELHNLPRPVSSSPKVDTKSSRLVIDKEKLSEVSNEEKK